MTSVNRTIEFIEFSKIKKSEFYQKTGLSNGYLDKVKELGADKIESIISIYSNLNLEWLITGKGGMLKRETTDNRILDNISHERAAELSIEAKEKLIPYYDIEFAAGALEMYNDPSQVSYYLDVPEFTGCTAFKVYGDSMYPKIANGTMVFAKKLDQWHEHIEYGRIYGVVCKDGSKFIKYVRKNKADPKNSFLLTSENENYDDFEMKLAKIHNVWMIHGWVVKVV